MKISDLGFKKGSIAECIVTTYNEDGSPNAAPMGVHTPSEKEVIMKIHAESDTCSNLLRSKGCVINVIFDPYLFLKTALVGRAKGGKEPEVRRNEIKRAKRVDAPFLRGAHAFVEAKLKEHKEYVKKDRYKKSRFCTAKCEVSRVVVNKRYPVAVNRGLYAAVELAIALSRERKDLQYYMKVMRKSLNSREYKKIKKLLVSLGI